MGAPRNTDSQGIYDTAGQYYESARNTVSDTVAAAGDAVSQAAGATKESAVKVSNVGQVGTSIIKIVHCNGMFVCSLDILSFCSFCWKLVKVVRHQ